MRSLLLMLSLSWTITPAAAKDPSPEELAATFLREHPIAEASCDPGAAVQAASELLPKMNFEEMARFRAAIAKKLPRNPGRRVSGTRDLEAWRKFDLEFLTWAGLAATQSWGDVGDVMSILDSLWIYRTSGEGINPRPGTIMGQAENFITQAIEGGQVQGRFQLWRVIRKYEGRMNELAHRAGFSRDRMLQESVQRIRGAYCVKLAQVKSDRSAYPDPWRINQ